MLALSLNSLCLKDNGCPAPSSPQARDVEFDTDLESDGKYSWITVCVVFQLLLFCFKSHTAAVLPTY